MKITPSFDLENRFSGIVAGVDEAGCGPWAGPVVAGAAIFMTQEIDEKLLSTIKDSKKLTAKMRAQVFADLEHLANDKFIYSHGLASVAEIDQLNIARATILAMQRAISSLSQVPTVALIDGIRKPNLACPVQTVIKGDQLSYSIAAASIIAKVTRDRLMEELHQHFPEYGWAQNAGYGTAKHQQALKDFGLTLHHRRSFKPISALVTAS